MFKFDTLSNLLKELLRKVTLMLIVYPTAHIVSVI